MNETKQPAWRVVWSTALSQWLGWKGGLILFAFSVLLSANTVLLVKNPELNVLTQLQIVDRTLHTAVLVGALAALLVGANAFSGERDHQTLESLLLTPAARGQIAVGKLLTALSIWAAMGVIAIPYILLVTDDTGVVASSLVSFALLGTVVVLLSVGIGLVVSAFSPTNSVSMALSVVIVLLLIAPTQLPPSVTGLKAVDWFTKIDPITAAINYQSAIVLDGEAWTAHLNLLVSPLIALFLIVGGGIAFIDRSLSLQGGTNP
jgi:ABC-2 type transport system permease protein